MPVKSRRHPSTESVEIPSHQRHYDDEGKLASYRSRENPSTGESEESVEAPMRHREEDQPLTFEEAEMQLGKKVRKESRTSLSKTTATNTEQADNEMPTAAEEEELLGASLMEKDVGTDNQETAQDLKADVMAAEGEMSRLKDNILALENEIFGHGRNGVSEDASSEANSLENRIEKLEKDADRSSERVSTLEHVVAKPSTGR